jgi:uncharacterized membrane protein YgcG
MTETLRERWNRKKEREEQERRRRDERRRHDSHRDSDTHSSVIIPATIYEPSYRPPDTTPSYDPSPSSIDLGGGSSGGGGANGDW